MNEEPEVPYDEFEPFMRGETDRAIEAVKVELGRIEGTLKATISEVEQRIVASMKAMEQTKDEVLFSIKSNEAQIKAVMEEVTQDIWTEALCPNCVGGDPGCLVCKGKGKVKTKLKDLPEV